MAELVIGELFELFSTDEIFQLDTSESPEIWSGQNRRAGHCHVVSLLVHNLCGGKIMCGRVNLNNHRSVVHYWNELPGGIVVDFTWSQFPQGGSYVVGIFDATSEALNTTTQAKYAVLALRALEWRLGRPTDPYKAMVRDAWKIIASEMHIGELGFVACVQELVNELKFSEQGVE